MKRSLARALHRMACRLDPLLPMTVRHAAGDIALDFHHHLRGYGIYQTVNVLPKIAEPPKVEPSRMDVAVADLKAAIDKDLAPKRKPKARVKPAGKRKA